MTLLSYFSAMQVVKFLNKLYLTMDKRMDKHDVYKVETISDQYLVVSGVPEKNGDKYHKYSICNCNLFYHCLKNIPGNNF